MPVMTFGAPSSLRHEPDVAFRQRRQRLLLRIVDSKAREESAEQGDREDNGSSPHHGRSGFRLASRKRVGAAVVAIGMPMACAARASACEEIGFVMSTK